MGDTNRGEETIPEESAPAESFLLEGETVKASLGQGSKGDCSTSLLQPFTDKVIRGDALEIMPLLPEESVDLVFMDPPYFLQLPAKELKRWKAGTPVEGVSDGWDAFASFEEYDGFMESIFSEVRRIMKPAATLWVIATYHSIFRLGTLLQDLGFWILNDVHWVKTNPMPNWLGVRFTNATETLIWATREQNSKGYTFHRDQAKEFGIGKVGANVWVLPLCSGKERLKDEKGKRLHSTQKPLELLRRVLLTSTNPGDLVLDPMAGVGTTGAAAQALGRKFLLIEKEPFYAERAATRLAGGGELTSTGNYQGEKEKIDRYLRGE